MIRPLTEGDGLTALLRAEVAVLYKHSPRCGGSLRAREEVERFAATHADVPVYQVDVVADRQFSARIAEHLGVRHASPQAIVLRRGAVTWSASHRDVDATALDQRVRAHPPVS